jgi:hypothetical protein
MESEQQQHNGHEHPAAYFSKHLSKTERNYSTSERELLAIVLASHHFKQFLYGGKFIVWIDHQTSNTYCHQKNLLSAY